MGNAMRDDPGLTASWTGQNQERSFDMLYGLPLRLGQRLEKMVHKGSFRGQAVHFAR